MFLLFCLFFFFFFNDTATTEIYTLSLHDALPICSPRLRRDLVRVLGLAAAAAPRARARRRPRAERRRDLRLVVRLVAARDPRRDEPVLLARRLRADGREPGVGDVGARPRRAVLAGDARVRAVGGVQ